ncbi:MAG: UDP-N-acetylmuramoyl-L-alanyl-D-glutamate--2,6-diaminopimelate ligase [Epulopiscium sp. Nele67-Bin005]|nr:MAG: UDP-N-acetylmuramoyl-L-alanyl-D-glutamate--2,6-diaminopimelate ligase [Epulopiscium sp. Nele67-Bin005]
MQLSNVLHGLDYKIKQGDLNISIDEIIYDSRIKTNEGLFVAIKGFSSDGHKYISSAISNGAKVVVIQDDVEVEGDVTVIKVDDTRYTIAILARNFYNNPSQSFNLVGVTGTNGKTSTTFLLGQMLEAHKQKVGIIGTIENRIGDKVLPTERTTPESLDLQKLFAQMNDENVDSVVMEVSSHALDLHRVTGCQFDFGIFTNLTQDHLDFHKDMESYAHAKAKLFGMSKVSIINKDADFSELMSQSASGDLITYAIDQEADYQAINLDIQATGVNYTLLYNGNSYDVAVPISGKFTVYNTLGAIVVAHKMGLDLEEIIQTLATVKGVPGRIQSFNSKNGYSVIVDYAHTPDGLENVLGAIEQFVKGKIITVFGCGGDRDNKKRPLMGAVVAKNSDYTIITSDNPRSEEPESIIDQIEVGVKEHTQTYIRQSDRKKAIHQAMEMAKEGDVVLVAGKGHETYQHLKDGIIHFDDSEVVKEFLEGEL